MKRILYLLAAAMFYGSAFWYSQGSWSNLTALGRNLVRPLLLPFVWQGLGTVTNTAEFVSQGRLLLALLPHWTDGHVLVASRLAYAAPSGSTSQELDQLTAALALLEQALEQHPPRPEEILTAMFTILEDRCRRDPALAEAFRQRLQQEPSVVADGYLARAIALHQSPSLEDARTVLQLRLVAFALRTGDRHALQHYLRSLRTGVAKLADQNLAREYRQALELLDRHLRDPGSVTLAELARHPCLQDVVTALRQVQVPIQEQPR